jgi:hypothetical protein
MFLKKSKKISVNNYQISIKTVQGDDYLSITDMLKSKDGEFFVTDWLRNKNTLEFLGVWESMYNPNFNYGEFAIIMNQAGVRHFKISVKEWVEKTNAVGLTATTGRYGGTYAHKDIAFEFGTWINPTFKLYLIREYQRLKEIESNQYNLEWDVKRIISKSNYIIHTDAVKDYILPKIKWNQNYTYSNEADLLNLVLFGITAKEWRDSHKDKAKAGGNIRDMASINELIILSNLESYNATLIKEGKGKEDRFMLLKDMAQTQMKSLHDANPIKSIKKLNDTTYLRLGENEN